MKKKLIKRLQALIVEIISANEEDLNKIGIELAEIEKKLIAYNDAKNN